MSGAASPDLLGGSAIPEWSWSVDGQGELGGLVDAAGGGEERTAGWARVGGRGAGGDGESGVDGATGGRDAGGREGAGGTSRQAGTVRLVRKLRGQLRRRLRFYRRMDRRNALWRARLCCGGRGLAVFPKIA